MSSARVSTVLAMVCFLTVFAVGTNPVRAVDTAFTYQGALMDMNTPADGLYDLQFKLYDHPDPNVGWQWGNTVSIDSLDVIEGYFTVELDFNDGVFDGAPHWLEIGVRAGELDDPNEYTILLPRQRLTPTPYAIHAETASRIVGQDSPTGVENQMIPYAGPYASLYDPASMLSGSGFTLNDLAGQLGGVGILRVGAVVSGSTIYENGSNVGIGTITPNDVLHLYNASDAMLAIQRGTNSAGDQAGIKFKVSGNRSNNYYYAGIVATRNAATSLDLHLATQAGPSEIDANDAKLTVLSGGNVGIGTRNPNDTLHLYDTSDAMLAIQRGTNSAGDQAGIKFKVSGNTSDNYYYAGIVAERNAASSIDLHFATQAGAGEINAGDAKLTILSGGNVGIGTTSPAVKLDVAGTTRTQILEITGGSDLAEPFNIRGDKPVQPGMVVSIDPEHIGQLRLSGKGYDRTVAGVISGANGIKAGLTMRQEDTLADGNHPVALTGRVYCLCDASTGPINPGDLLTTSNTPGHAMKVTNHTRAAGAILGKAMSKLEKGKGLVLILVSLQ